MSEFLNFLEQARAYSDTWEMIAVTFAIIYLLLAIKENIWCWPAALISTLIYVFLFFDVNLYMESALQIFYIIMAIYGWILWHKHQNKAEDLQISSWGYQKHLLSIALILLLTIISGALLNNNTDAVYPWLDSFSTWSAVITTWMVAKKVLENWIYWIVIDSVGIFLFVQRELYPTAILFAVYVILCFVGYRQWHITYKMSGKPVL